MTRLFAFWIILGIALTAATIGTAYGLFSHVDLTFESFTVLACVPLFQALVLAWSTARRPSWSAQDGIRLTRPAPVTVLAADVALVILGVALHGTRVVGFGGDRTIQPLWIATKAVLAAACLAALTIRERGNAASGRPGNSAWLVPGAFGACLVAAGCQAIWPWTGSLLWSARSTVLGLQPVVFAELEINGLLFGIFVGLAVWTGRQLERLWPAAPVLWVTGIVLSVCAALTAILGRFLLPTLVVPYRTIAMICCSVASTLFLLTAREALRTGSSDALAG
jgi:hypothetical protein